VAERSRLLTWGLFLLCARGTSPSSGGPGGRGGDGGAIAGTGGAAGAAGATALAGNSGRSDADVSSPDDGGAGADGQHDGSDATALVDAGDAIGSVMCTDPVGFTGRDKCQLTGNTGSVKVQGAPRYSEFTTLAIAFWPSTLRRRMLQQSIRPLHCDNVSSPASGEYRRRSGTASRAHHGLGRNQVDGAGSRPDDGAVFESQ
jgi:hypothetical protein